jgi:hypothetical protein
VLQVDVSQTKQKVGQLGFDDVIVVGVSHFVTVHSLGALSEKEQLCYE